MVSMSDEPKERNILKLILIVRFACVPLDVGHPIFSSFSYLMLDPSEPSKVGQMPDTSLHLIIWPPLRCRPAILTLILIFFLCSHLTSSSTDLRLFMTKLMSHVIILFLYLF
jgi:hypothetical protein